jgi:imidazolonepropionase-like amidohydrolase
VVTPPVLLHVSHLFAASGDEVITDGVVRVEGGMIAAVGRASEFGTTADGIPTVDGTLLPGFVDSHAHVTMAGVRPEQMYFSPETAALTAVAQLRRSLRAGVTTMLDCGAVGSTAFAIRHALETGLIEGPRLRVVGRPITHARGHGHMFGSVADGPDAVRREVRILNSEGADEIKLMASGGSSGGNPTRPSYTQAELNACVTEAHGLGLRVTTHAERPGPLSLVSTPGSMSSAISSSCTLDR